MPDPVQVPEPLFALAAMLSAPLYLVGGCVRDHLAGTPSLAPDRDLSSPVPETEFLRAAERCGFSVRAVYRATGTVKLEDGEGNGYEFTRFRSDRYVRGGHAPAAVTFTDDIVCDARRRDFRANAVYFNVKEGTFADPLGGMEDIRRRRLCTVREAARVFGEDGLRLMRLSRLSAQTGFLPDEECLEGAKENAALIEDIVPERVFSELTQLLSADAKHGDKEAPYRGLKVFEESGVLAHVLPELALGKGMEQNRAYHVYDVLEHSLRCVRYAPPEIRLAALLHDVGKPFCFLRDGNFYAHAEEGARIARAILNRLRAPSKTTSRTAELVRLHMADFRCDMRKGKLRRVLVSNYPLLNDLLALKQADYSACKDDLSAAPCVVRWRQELAQMRAEGVPFTLKELKVNGNDLVREGVPREQIAHALAELADVCTFDGARNNREFLIRYVRNHLAG